MWPLAPDHDGSGPLARSDSIEPWLEDVRAHVGRVSAHLLPVFDTYANEARFAHGWLLPSLRNIPVGVRILEVGAGLTLVSCQLIRQGYRVSALEPIGDGFSSFRALQDVVLQLAAARHVLPEVLAIPIERLELQNCFDLAFSVNVMEHVDDVDKAIECVGRSLKPDGTYRFTCPNYTFPYEPHFDIPTLFSKRLTQWFFHRRIFQSTQVEDQVAMWRSLNWISVASIGRACRAARGLRPSFDRSMVCQSFERLGRDAAFAGRRSRWVVVLAGWMVSCRLHKALAWVPATLQPVIDCSILRSGPLAGRGG